MTETEIYLDNNATTPLLPEVFEAIAKAAHSFPCNPSSLHQAGERGRRLLTKARDKVGELIGASGDNIVFCSSGTEANNTVLRSMVKNGARRIITTAIEHKSILSCCDALEAEGVDVVYLPVNKRCQIDSDTIKSYINNETAVSIQVANNETGTLLPVDQISDFCRQYGVPLHIDAAQSVGKLLFELNDSISFMTFTGHKLHAPSGIAAIYAKDTNDIQPLSYGGNQEHGKRPGTENILGIVGFGKACEIRQKNLKEHLELLHTLQSSFERKLLNSEAILSFNGEGSERLCSTSNVRFHGADGLAIVSHLDRNGVRCSQTSACQGMIQQPSHVLLAMGLSEDDAYSSIRFSFSVLNTCEEVNIAVEHTLDAVSKQSKILNESLTCVGRA